MPTPDARRPTPAASNPNRARPAAPQSHSYPAQSKGRVARDSLALMRTLDRVREAAGIHYGMVLKDVPPGIDAAPREPPV